MTTGESISHEIGGTVQRLHEQLDTALGRTVDLHRTGASEEAVLAETAVAVGAAKALEILTGESWESQLARRETGAVAAPPPVASAQPRRWLRRNKPVGP